jgi:WhiB family redox-sensing transcriptional regulator
MSWRELALCQQVDPEIFFPDKGSSLAAKRVCGSCEVSRECLEDAMANHERYGVWGGFSEADRRRIRRGRKTA